MTTTATYSTTTATLPADLIIAIIIAITIGTANAAIAMSNASTTTITTATYCLLLVCFSTFYSYNLVLLLLWILCWVSSMEFSKLLNCFIALGSCRLLKKQLVCDGSAIAGCNILKAEFQGILLEIKDIQSILESKLKIVLPILPFTTCGAESSDLNI